MERDTFSDQAVVEDIQTRFVPLNVAAESNETLLRKLQVRTFPTTVILSPQARMLDYIPGYVGPQELRMRLATATRSVAAARR
jgi:thioredoxin-related protein